MAFIELKRDAFENVSVSLRPKIHFISSSIGEGVTGSEYVAPVRSKCIRNVTPKELSATASLETVEFTEIYNPEIFAGTILPEHAKAVADAGGTDISDLVAAYLDTIVSHDTLAPRDLRYSKTLDIFRFDPSFKFEPPAGLNVTIKNNVRNIMMPYYKYAYQDCGFHYRNYNTINFFTASSVPSSAVLMYPDSNNKYIPTSSFSVGFWINPRYQNDADAHYHAGTVLHVSSSFCLSVISSSHKDELGRADKFKIQLQLSQSADIAPSKINFSSLTYPSDLVFTSSYLLSKNHWHHVTVTWGGESVNNYTGSINIDNDRTLFVVPSSSISTNTHNTDGAAIFVGNYYDGPSAEISKFFNQTVSTTEGVEKIDPSAGTTDPLTSKYNFSHMLNGEIHEIKIYDKFLSGSEIAYHRNTGSGDLNNLLFYVPPYFYPESTTRDILQTPFQKFSTSSNDPFNVAFSFGVGGKEINAENFVRDFKQKSQPRLYMMTGSTINTTVVDITADEYVYHKTYAQGPLLRRNFLILPNDNGQFIPSWDVLENQATGSLTSSFQTSGQGVDYGLISLENLIPESSIYTGMLGSTGSIIGELMGPTPETPGVVPGSVLTIAQRTRDVSSNEVVIYNISNLYYGNRISPETFEIIETDLTGSEGKLSFNIKDNGRGLLYRADSLTKHAKWASVGNIFYDEGIAIIKTPHLFYINKDRTELKFRGEHNVHTMTINVPVHRDLLNSSSNKTFTSMPPSENISDSSLSTVKLTAVNIHDENFNIIMRANFAQPILKTEEDEFVVRLKEDF